jgi:hypothetical protein
VGREIDMHVMVKFGFLRERDGDENNYLEDQISIWIKPRC